MITFALLLIQFNEFDEIKKDHHNNVVVSQIRWKRSGSREISLRIDDNPVCLKQTATPQPTV
jgi:hypothetical protein